MSGGSFDYLYCKDCQDIRGYTTTIEDMSEALKDLGAEDAAEATRKILKTIKSQDEQLSGMLMELENVWKAVEWWRSCDTGVEDVQEALDEYRAGANSAVV